MTLVDLLGSIGVSGNATGSDDGLLASGILCDCTGLLGGVTNVGEAEVWYLLKQWSWRYR